MLSCWCISMHCCVLTEQLPITLKRGYFGLVQLLIFVAQSESVIINPAFL
jgi:hypothetical protein